jgi:hypothetical protein
VRANFNLSFLRVNLHFRALYLDVLKQCNITMCLRTTEAAYNITDTIPYELLQATKLLVQDVPVELHALEDIGRTAAAVDDGRYSYSINETDFPNLETLLVTFIPCETRTASISVYINDDQATSDSAIAGVMLARTMSRMRPFLGDELHKLLTYPASAACEWFPTMIIHPDIDPYPRIYGPGVRPILLHNADLPQIVLVKEGNTRDRSWDVRRTIDINKLPQSLPSDNFTSLYMRAALGPLIARGERIEVFFALEGALKEKAGTGRLHVTIKASDSLARLFATTKINRVLGETMFRLSIGRLVQGPSFEDQEVKQGEEFAVALTK